MLAAYFAPKSTFAPSEIIRFKLGSNENSCCAIKKVYSSASFLCASFRFRPFVPRSRLLFSLLHSFTFARICTAACKGYAIKHLFVYSVCLFFVHLINNFINFHFKIMMSFNCYTMYNTLHIKTENKKNESIFISHFAINEFAFNQFFTSCINFRASFASQFLGFCFLCMPERRRDRAASKSEKPFSLSILHVIIVLSADSIDCVWSCEVYAN